MDYFKIIFYSDSNYYDLAEIRGFKSFEEALKEAKAELKMIRYHDRYAVYEIMKDDGSEARGNILRDYSTVK